MKHHLRLIPTTLLTLFATILISACSSKTLDTAMDVITEFSQKEEKQASHFPPVSGKYGDFLIASYAENEADFNTSARVLYQLWKNDPSATDITYNAFKNNLVGGFHQRALEISQDIKKRNLTPPNPNEQNFLNLFTAAQHLKNKNYALAERELKENIIPINLAKFVTPIMLAWTQIGLNKPKEAIKILQGKNKDSPIKSILLLNKAYIHIYQGEYNKAGNAIKTLLDQLKNPPSFLLGLYAKLLFLDKGSVASNSYLRALPHSNAKTHLMQLLRPGNDFRVEMLGITEPELGFAEGLNELNKILSDESPRVGILFAQLSLMIAPNNNQSILILANALFELKRYSQAARQLLKISDANSPFYRDAATLRAEAEQNAGNVDKAVKIMQKAIALFPNDYDLHFELGQIYQHEENYRESAQVFTKAIEGRHFDNQRWSDYYYRGIAYERTDRWPLAEKDFLKALDIDPNNPFVLNYLGYSWVDKRHNIDRALGMLKIAVEREPHNAFILDSYGWALYRLEKFDQAKKFLEKAVLQEPSESVINDHLGDVYWHLGRKLEAKFQWQHALALNPEELDDRQKIQEKIDGKRIPTP